jgi:hypothetical protein
MRALSINQPWGWAIVHGGKDIENRDWHTNYRGEFLIHVGLKYDVSDDPFVLQTSGFDYYDPEVVTGGIIGKAEIVDCVRQSDSPWFFGRYGFVIRNARPLPFRPCKGRLGFFIPDYSSRYKRDLPKLKPAANSNLDAKLPLFQSSPTPTQR